MFDLRTSEHLSIRNTAKNIPYGVYDKCNIDYYPFSEFGRVWDFVGETFEILKITFLKRQFDKQNTINISLSFEI